MVCSQIRRSPNWQSELNLWQAVLRLARMTREGRCLRQAERTQELETDTINDVDGTSFQQQIAEDFDFILLAVRDVEKRRDAAAQIQQSVLFDSALESVGTRYKATAIETDRRS